MYPDCEPILCMQVARLGVMFVALNGRIVDVQHFLSCRALSGWLGGGGGGGGADGDGGAVLTLHKFEPLESALQECVHNRVCGTQCSITWLHSQRCGTRAVRMRYACTCVCTTYVSAFRRPKRLRRTRTTCASVSRESLLCGTSTPTRAPTASCAGSLNVLSQWRHRSLPWPLRAGSQGSWLRYAPGRAFEPLGSLGACGASPWGLAEVADSPRRLLHRCALTSRLACRYGHGYQSLGSCKY